MSDEESQHSRVCAPLSFAALGVPHNSCFCRLSPRMTAQTWEGWGKELEAQRCWERQEPSRFCTPFSAGSPGALLKRSQRASVFVLLCSELSWDGKAGVTGETPLQGRCASTLSRLSPSSPFQPLSLPPPCVPRYQSGDPKISFPCLDSTASRRSSLLTPFPHPSHKPLIWAIVSGLSLLIPLSRRPFLVVAVQSLYRVQFFATPWTVACQAPLFMGILQERLLEWVAMPFSGDIPNPGIEPMSPSLQADS